MSWLNQNDNKIQTSRSFSILFSVMGSLESLESLEFFLTYFPIFLVLYQEIVQNIDQMYKILFPITS